MDIKSVPIRLPSGANVVVGQSHFIKTVEEIAEIVVTTVPQAKYGLAFNESSGPCLVRAEGNDTALKATTVENAQAIAAVESEQDVAARKEFLRKIGYKF